MRRIAMRFHIVLALLVGMLACGRGLPGLIEGLHGPAAHVCTCASGGDHRSCPVCNPALTEHHTSRALAIDGVPCGDPRVAVGAPGEVATLPAPLIGIAPAGAWVAAPRPQRLVVEQTIPEPATPPPRLS